MSLQTDLTNDMRLALKSRDQVKLDTIRFILSQIKNLAIDKGRELTDQEILQAIAKQVKQQKEVIIQYEQAGRTDLVQEEAAQVAILETYLPPQMSDQELRQVIAQRISQTPKAHIGQLIGMVNKQVAGRAEGFRVATQVKKQLNM